MMGAARAIWLLVRMSVRVAPWQSAACLCESIGVALNLLRPLYLAWFVSGAIEHDAARMTTATIAFVVQVGVGRLLIIIGMNARAGQLERVGYAFDTRIAEITAGTPDVEHFDNPEYLDQMQILREEAGALGLAVNTLLNTLSTLTAAIGTIALAITADWRMLLVAAAGLPSLLFAPLVVRWQTRAEQLGAESGRLANHLLHLGTTPAAAGELRIFDLAAPLRGRLGEATRAWRAPKLALARRESAVTVASQVLFYGSAAAVLSWLVSDVIAGHLTVGALTLALLLVGRLQGTSSEMRSVIGQVASMSRTAGRFLWLLDAERELHRRYTGIEQPPAVLRDGITLSALTYRYPNATALAVDSISLDLPAGSVIALVGENGAGKSTLVNLLTGLLPATGGTMRIDGRDSRQFDLTAWRRQLAGAFQDHVRYEFTIRDAVGIGDIPARTDDSRVREAMRAGAAEAVLDSVPRGLSTQLGATWQDGVDLSGGQWQRITIARGMMRRSPILRVLDEPTAALDAATEHELFDRYTAAARVGRSSGTVTVLVTHRFSTVSAADLVVVLDRGRVVEQGSHGELMARRGYYAELYELQARGYR
ncbi:MAG TPA: ABC transporter ATP-binding protein [Mycobacteriales bacterium]|jgi:ATP-binding cassette subfamily B protein|nr:ABC transporter ATP-binding protein [Mycobacteriales bacterium]